MSLAAQARGYIRKNKVSIALSVALAAVVLIYSRYPHPALGLAGFFLIVGLIASDFFKPEAAEKKAKAAEKAKVQARDGGWKLIVELFVALAVAVAAWFAFGFVLQTDTPLNVVTSCSMLPNLERGDLIVLQGGGVSAQEVQIDANLSGASYESNPYYITGGESRLAVMFTDVVVGGSQPFSYPLRSCTLRNRSGSEQAVPCAPIVQYGNANYSSAGNDVIVYNPEPRIYGLIIHRALLRLKADDGYYYLTKGDNNQFADQRTGIQLVPASDVKGKVLLRIPLLGYLKLFFFLQIEEPKGCDAVLSSE